MELLQESKAFYVKSERVLDTKQELPHSDRLHVRSPMLGLSSTRGTTPSNGATASSNLSRSLSHREFGIEREDESCTTLPVPRIRREGLGNTTLPVEKRRLAIRKDNPLPLNVTAVKRLFFSRGTEETSQIRKMAVKTSPKVIRVTFSPTSGSTPLPCNATPPSSGSSKKLKSRLSFCEVLPCICQQQQQQRLHLQQQHQPQQPQQSQTILDSKPPQLPNRMSKNQPSPPPPIPPKSPALNARLKLLSQQSMKQNQESSKSHQLPCQMNTSASLSQRAENETSSKPILNGDEGVTNAMSVRMQSDEQSKNHHIEHPPSVTSAMDSARMNFIRSAVLHKSLPDLNSPKSRHRCVSGRLRGASTELGSCSECDSSQMSRSSSVNLNSSDSVSSESSNECNARIVPSETRPRPRSAAGERATSDYASRSPSFKYETTSLVQVNQRFEFMPKPTFYTFDILQATKVWVKPWTLGEEHPTETRTQFQDRGSAPAFPADIESTDGCKRKPILRSKSDVGQARFAVFPDPALLLMAPAEFSGDVPIELERFFDNIGLDGGRDGGDARGIFSPSASGRSTPVYFSSVSSIDSSCKRRHVDNIYESSDSEDVAATLHRRLLGKYANGTVGFGSSLSSDIFSL